MHAVFEIGGTKRVHARPKRTNARKHHSIGIANKPWVDAERRIATDALQRLLSGPQIADAVVEHSNNRTT